MRPSLLALVLAPVALATAGACGSTSPQCRVGADCASGACDSAGRCVPVSHDAGTGKDGSSPSGDSGVSESGTPVDGGGGADTAPGDDASSSGSDASGLCVPNHDGVIVREEVPMLPGLHANYRIAENVTIDTAGVMNANGTRSWDFSGGLSGDHTVLVTTDAPGGQWFSAQYASATYTTKLSDTATLLGIFQGTPSALQLLGVASPSSGTGDTELTYNPPAEILGVPMMSGSKWSSTSNITGTASGLVSNYLETYASQVDAVGTLVVPYGTFDVMRVQTVLTRNALGVVSVTRSFSWVAECFGPVAAATSQTDETQVEFTNAAEVRRLTP